MVTIDWQSSGVALRLLAPEGGPVRLVDLGPELVGPADPERYRRMHQPLVEVMGPRFTTTTAATAPGTAAPTSVWRCATPATRRAATARWSSCASSRSTR